MIRGWLSDEDCARGRASSGMYTATNPDCAKRCVANGKKIVLIVPDEKAVLNIANQQAAKSNVGNYVEISGTWDSQVLRISSIKLLSQGRAMCSLPQRTK